MRTVSRILLRPATIGDLTLLRSWDRQSHVIAGKGDEDWEWESELASDPPWREQLIAELDGRAIGFVQSIDTALEETHYWGNTGPGFRAVDIWIGEAEMLGQGYGTMMMKLAIEKCFSSPDVKAILVDPLPNNTRAHHFYRRLGFRFVGDRLLDGERCPVFRLDRNDWHCD